MSHRIISPGFTENLEVVGCINVQCKSTCEAILLIKLKNKLDFVASLCSFNLDLCFCFTCVTQRSRLLGDTGEMRVWEIFSLDLPDLVPSYVTLLMVDECVWGWRRGVEGELCGCQRCTFEKHGTPPTLCSSPSCHRWGEGPLASFFSTNRGLYSRCVSRGWLTTCDLFNWEAR